MVVSGFEKAHCHSRYDGDTVCRGSEGQDARKTPGGEFRSVCREALEQDGDVSVADLHIWAVAPGSYSVIASVVTSEPQSPEHYKGLLPRGSHLVHRTVEVHRCRDLHAPSGSQGVAADRPRPA